MGMLTRCEKTTDQAQAITVEEGVRRDGKWDPLLAICYAPGAHTAEKKYSRAMAY
jgi:hypothetical protein